MSGFVYKQREDNLLKKRATQSISGRDSYIRGDFPSYKLKEGRENRIRVMPPTWENASHWGYDIWLHYTIGPDKATYLCPEKMKKLPCPICEERYNTTDEEYAKALEPSLRVLQWIIDRDDEKSGPTIWAAPPSFDRDVCRVATDDENGSALAVDNPDEGYDIKFELEGKKPKLQYKAVKCSRIPSPLNKDKEILNRWLQLITENSLPKILQFYDYERIKTVSSGTLKAEAKVTSEEPHQQHKEEIKTPGYTYEAIQALTGNELDAVATAVKVNVDDIQNMNDDQLKDYLCEKLNLKKAVEEDPKARLSSLRNRLNTSSE